MITADEVRLHIFAEAAATGSIPQPREIAKALRRNVPDVIDVLKELAANKVLVLAPGDAAIWIAAPFCAVPTSFRVSVHGRRYWSICIWDALGVIAATGALSGSVHTRCGDCAEQLELNVVDGKLVPSDNVIHFGVPAKRWWDNIGFT